MKVYSEEKNIVEVCSVLGNEKRLQLLKKLKEMDGGRLREIHAKTSNVTGLSHRETTHKYLEQLVDASLVEKKSDEAGGVLYRVSASKIVLQIVDNS